MDQYLKSDKILMQLFAEQQMVAADNRLRKLDNNLLQLNLFQD